MKAVVERRLEGATIATAEQECKSIEDLGLFLAKMGVFQNLKETVLDFNSPEVIYYMEINNEQTI